MPELPEVETTVRGLRPKVIGRVFADAWTDWPKTVKKPKPFDRFKKEIKGKKILGVRRRAKNILFDLSGEKTLLVHQKMTGHLLVGRWEKKDGKWEAPEGPLQDKMNSYIHLMFIFKNGRMMALSDLRKFAKVELWGAKELEESKDMKSLGPEPLEKDFTFAKFKKRLEGQKRNIKQVLMDPFVIAGIGNIYSDEILWRAKVHPLERASGLPEGGLKRIYESIKKILLFAVNLKGESFSDYRVPSGEKGGFDDERKAYQREGEKCSRCGAAIKRVKIGGRSAHFCPKCQQAHGEKL
jgi:formamidopyrimidine-DNA glycosylase